MGGGDRDNEAFLQEWLGRARRRPSVLAVLAGNSEPPPDRVQARFAGSRLVDSVLAGRAAESSPTGVVQRARAGSGVSDAPAFRNLTPATQNQARGQGVEAIDAALDTYHNGNQAQALVQLDAVIAAIDDHLAGGDGVPYQQECTALRVAAVAEKPNVERLAALAVHGKVADLTTLGQVAQMTLAEINALAPLQQVTNVAELGQLQGRQQNAAAIVRLAALAQVNNAARLAAAAGWARPIADIETLANLAGAGLDGNVLPAAPTFAQLESLATAQRSLQGISVLMGLEQGSTAADLVTLVASARPSEQVRVLALGGAPAGLLAQVAAAATQLQPVQQTNTSLGMWNRNNPRPYGMTFPEQVEITLTAYLAGGRWYAAATALDGVYSQRTELRQGQSEVTGPNGNTNRGNYAAQIRDLGALGEPRGRQADWYMLQAVIAHENVHLAHFLPQLRAMEPVVQAMLSQLAVDQGGQVNNRATALQAIRDLDAFPGVVGKVSENWRSALAKQLKVDHRGATAAAEHALVDPMIADINQAAEDRQWGPRIDVVEQVDQENDDEYGDDGSDSD